jgi:enolase
MSVTVARMHAVEIIDSRGNPTVFVSMTTRDGLVVESSVPSGASTGKGEAVELRDDDPHRFGGNGVLAAVGNINGPIAAEIVGHEFHSLPELDTALRNCDGTGDKSRLGANAVVGVSIAASRMFAASEGLELWQFLSSRTAAPCLPVPHFTVVDGGVHAANNLDIQEFMIAPVGAPLFSEALRAGSEIYSALRERLIDADEPVGLGDEGGFAPGMHKTADVLDALVDAVHAAGYETGPHGVMIALDAAASEFHSEGSYVVDGKVLTTEELIDLYEELVERFPIRSIEDALAEDDWDGWASLTTRLGDRVQLVGDDIFVTNAALIDRAVASKVANAALVKVNQVGTVTETLDTMAACREVGFRSMVSHRSGETTDTFIADLAVGSGCGQIKAGAPARGERVAKYNRINQIAAAAPHLSYGLDGTDGGERTGRSRD